MKESTLISKNHKHIHEGKISIGESHLLLHHRLINTSTNLQILEPASINLQRCKACMPRIDYESDCNMPV